MPRLRNFIDYPSGMTAALVVLFSVAAFAQEAEDEAVDDTTDDSEIIEEIIVIAPRPGDRRRVDPEYDDPVRAQLLKDFFEMQQDQAEYEWRQPADKDDPSRVTWGYDPRDDYRMRREMDLQELQELPNERDKPATLFRFSF